MRTLSGMSGVTTLILFIALVLVAAIAALVLLQTGSILQNQAQKSGRTTERDISTRLDILQIMGDINKDDGKTVRSLRIQAKLAPGSKPVALNGLTISARGGKGAHSFGYSGIAYRDASGNNDQNCLEAIGAIFDSGLDITDPIQWDNSDAFIDEGTGIGKWYSVKWTKGPPADNQVLEPDTLIEIFYNINNKLDRQDQITMDFVLASGSSTQIPIATETSFPKRYEKLFP